LDEIVIKQPHIFFPYVAAVQINFLRYEETICIEGAENQSSRHTKSLLEGNVGNQYWKTWA